MKSAITFLIALALTSPVANLALGDVTANPLGIIIAAEHNDSLAVELTLANNGDADVSYSIRLSPPPEEELRQGPRRDDLGDRIAFHALRRGWCGIAWDEEALICGGDYDGSHIYFWNIEDEEYVGNGFNASLPYGVTFDGEAFWIGLENGSVVRYDRAGRNLSQFNAGYAAFVAWDGDLLWTYPYWAGNNLHQRNLNGQVVRTINCANVPGQNNANQASMAVTWVPEHDDGHMWGISENGTLVQLDLDLENNRVEVVAQRNLNQAGGCYGITHDGENIWYSVYSGNEQGWVVVDDGIEEPSWLQIDPAEGVIEAEDAAGVNVIFQPVGMEAGVYEMRILIDLSEADRERDQLYETLIEMSAVMALESPVANVVGVVTAAHNGESLEGARIDNDAWLVSSFTDGDGIYAFENLPLGEYELTFSKPEYLPAAEAVELDEEGELELNVALLHSECTLNRDMIETSLVENTSREFDISVTNGGDGVLTYTVERRLPGAEADPWEQRFAFQAGQEVRDNRLKGVAFADGNFFVTGIGGEETMIYVLDRDGAIVNSFPQVGTARNGMDGLAWDGELLWGAGENLIYGFTTDGDSATSFRGAQRTTRAITWDPVNEWLWTSDASSDIIAVERGNEEPQVTLNRRGQTVHALAFFEDDPDGFQLYVLSTLNDTLALRKMSLDNGELRFVTLLEPAGGGSPTGASITSSFDYYSTVFISTVDIPEEDGGDRIDIWQVRGNIGWMQIIPTEGAIAPGESQDFTLTLDATDLARLDYEGQVVWVHDGFDFEAAVDVLLHVTGLSDPPTAFSLLEPADGDTLPEGDASFVWQQSVDPNPEDVVEYQIWFQQGEDSVMVETSDTTLLVPLAELGLENVDVHVPVSWWVVAVSGADEVECNARFGFYLPGAGVDDHPSQPAEFALYGAYPNPFNSRTRVSFSVPSPSSSVRQTFLSVYDLSGRKVADLWAGQAEAGVHEVVFDAAGLSSGVYLLQLESAGQTARMKVALVR